MLDDCFSRDVVIAMNNSSFPLVHAHSRKAKGRTLTSVSTSDNSIFVFFKSYALDKPIVCKITQGAKNVKFTIVSPTLEQIVCVSNNSKISLISLKEVLDYDSTSHISSCIDKSIFPPASFNPSNFEPSHLYSNFELKPTQNPILNAFWWKLPGNLFNMIIVDTHGFAAFSLHDFNPRSYIFPVEDVICADFRQTGVSVSAVVCNKTQVFLFEFFEKNGIITAKKKDLHIALDPKYQVYMQVCPVESNWLVSVVQKNMITLDNKLKETKITDIPLNAAKIAGFAITKHFLFEISSGNLYAKFLNAQGKNIQIARNVLQLNVTDYDNDLIIYTTTESAETAQFNGSPSTFATNLMKNKLVEEAGIVAQAFGMEINSIILQAIEELCRNNEFNKAIELTDFLTCSEANAIKIFIKSGSERSALHLVRRKPIENSQKIINLLMKKIYSKMSIFPLFERIYSKMVNKGFSYPSPEEFAQSGLLKELKENEKSFLDIYPASLIFHIQMHNEIESQSAEILCEASPLDIPHTLSSFSPYYAALLSMLKAHLPKKEEELPYPISSQINKIGNINVYVSDNNLVYNEEVVLTNVSLFVVFKEKMYVLLTNGNILQTDKTRLNFSSVQTIPALKIVASDNYLCMLSVAGPLFFIQNTNEYFKVIDGSYADICVGKSIYAIDEDGQLLDVLNNNRILYNERFVREITCTEDSVICNVVPNDLIIINKKGAHGIDLGFKAEIMKGGKKALLAGEGKIAIIDENGVTKKDYSRRVGTIRDIMIDTDESIIIIGSSSQPVRLLKEQIQPTEDITFDDFCYIYKHFSEQVLFGLFNSPKYTAILSILYKKWSLLGDDLVSAFNYLNRLPIEHASETFHQLLNRKVFIDGKISNASEYLDSEYARKCFLDNPKDLYLIPQQNLLEVVKPPKKPTVEETGMKLLQKASNSSTSISAAQACKEGLVVFSCGHIFEHETLINATKHMQKASKKKYISIVSQEYQSKKIPMQCPRCLEAELERGKLL